MSLASSLFKNLHSYFFASHSSSSTTNAEVNNVNDPADFLQSNGLSFVKFYNESKEKCEVLLSPFSIMCAMLALYTASDGETYKSLQTFFQTIAADTALDKLVKIDNDLKKSMCVHTSNHIILRDDIQLKTEYTNKIGVFFNIETFNSSTVGDLEKRVNSIVATNTKGLIPEILSPGTVSNATIEIILNTVYFKANWINKFEQSNTTKKMFQGIKSKEIDMMTQYYAYNKYFENKDFQLLELNYEGGQFSMGFLLPINKRNTSIHSSFLDWTNLSYAISHLWNEELQEIRIPKFKTECKYHLQDCFTKIHGLGQLFEKCNLSNMTDNNMDFHVSDIIHKAVIIVDETGTEAAAATAIRASTTSCAPVREPKKFIADHTFFYYIRHQPSNTLLFMGIYQ